MTPLETLQQYLDEFMADRMTLDDVWEGFHVYLDATKNTHADEAFLPGI